MKNKYSSVIERQSYVVKSGKNWEDSVLSFLNDIFRKRQIGFKVIKGSSIKRNSVIWEKLSIPVSDGKRIWGDVDLVVVDENNNPIGIISCKTSLHGRFSETLFYAVVLKNQIPNIKFMFTTTDKGRQPKSGRWQSEWGSEEKPTKDRLLGSYYLDGVYINNPNTKLGGKIKSLKDLPDDLIKWAEKFKK